MNQRNDRPPSGETRAATRSRAAQVVARLLTVLLVLLLLVAGGYAAYWFNATEGRAEQSADADEEVARLVETTVARRGAHRVHVRAMGTVGPAREAVIRPRVSGMITEQHESFVPGGLFAAGTWMVQIDRADYEQALRQSQSELARAEASLEIERGDQAVAREELELLEVDIPEINRELILRIPQVNQAEAQVQIAEAAVERARLDLERTRIVAPFDGHLVSRSVSVGNNVAAGDQLATLVGSHEYWIELTVPVSSLTWIEASGDGDEPGSRALVRSPRMWGPGVQREGRVTRLIGRLEAGSRLARVIVSVSDPLARSTEHEGERRLLLDAFVEVEIEGRVLADSFHIDRDLIREGHRVWVMGGDDRLVTREVTVAYAGPEDAWITGGLEDGDRVIRTNLQAPVDGMLLRTAGSDDAGGETARSGGSTSDG